MAQPIGGFQPLNWQTMTQEEYNQAYQLERNSQASAWQSIVAAGGATEAGLDIARGLNVNVPAGYQPSEQLMASLIERNRDISGAKIGGVTMPDMWQSIGGDYTQTQPGALVPAGVIPGDPSTYTKLQAGMPAIGGAGGLVGIAGGVAGIGNFLMQNWPAIAGMLGLGAAGGAAGAGITSLISGALGGGGVGGGAVSVGGVPISGPGVPEPPANMVSKQWVTLAHSNTVGNYYIYFFKLIDGRIMCYNPAKKEWKIWKPKKMIVLSPDPRMSQIKKLDRVYNRTMRTLAKKTKALKLAK